MVILMGCIIFSAHNSTNFRIFNKQSQNHAAIMIGPMINVGIIMLS